MQAIQEFIASNALVCFIVLALVYAVGDWLGTVTKAWVPSTFVVACIFLVGYWTIFPTEIVSLSGLSAPFTSTICIYLLITHMGTSISLRELLKQWKVIVICLAGLVGMLLAGWFIAGLFVDRELIVAGLPPLTGGLVAALTMQQAAQQAGLTTAAILAIAMYSAQGFAGYPLTAVCLKIEGRRLLRDFRSGKTEAVSPTMAGGDMETASAEPEKRKLIPPTPKKYFTTAVALLKVSVVALAAMYIGRWTGISGAVWALLLGIACTELGFLEKDILKQCGCFSLVAYAVMLYIFDGLKEATPEIMGAAIGPMIALIVIGVAGMALFAFIISRVLKMTFPMAFAVNLTALYGFPPNYILTDEACKALAENEDERTYLMDHMLPQMIVGGFVTVTITSVLIAGFFTQLF